MTITVRTIFSINATDGSHDFLVIRRGPAGISIEAHSREDEWESATAGPFTPEQLRAALDEVAPAGSYTRTESPDLLDGGMMCAAVEAEAASDTLLLVQQQRDQATARAEKAERERDEARARINDLVSVPAESRPLTPDAITDEMVRRALGANGQPETSVDSPSGRRLRVILTAALTEPPKRPEGAEDMETFLAGLDYMHDETGASRADLATLANDLAMLIVEQP